MKANKFVSFVRKPKTTISLSSLSLPPIRRTFQRTRPLITRNPASASVRAPSRIMTFLTRVPRELALTRASHVSRAIPDDHDCNDRNSEDRVGGARPVVGLASAGHSVRASCRANDARRSGHQSYFHYTDRSCSTLTPRPARHCYYSETGDVRCTMRAARFLSYRR